MRERRRLDRRAVVEAATMLADQRGLEHFTLADLAGTLEIKTPSLYNHVASLADLRRELQLTAARELQQRFLDGCVGKAGEDAVLAIARAYRSFARERPGLYQALQAAPATEDREAQAAAALLVEILTRVLESMGLRGETAIHAVRALRSAMHGFVTLERLGGFGLPTRVEESWDFLVELLVRGLDTLPRGNA